MNLPPHHLALTTIATGLIVLIAACSEDAVESERCPPGADFDEELQRCISDHGEDDAGTPINSVDPSDTGGGDDIDPTEPDSGSPDADSGSPDADTGIFDVGDDDTGAFDAGDIDADEPDPCDDITCGQNAFCDGGSCDCYDGYDGDPYDECFLPPPCDGDCGYGATCIDDQCLCDPGFVPTGDDCEVEDVSDPATRTENQVCQRWNEDPWQITFDKWAQEPQDQCDWGWLKEEYHLEAIAETTRYRWLVGLPAVTASESAREITQACATTLAAEDVLTHDVTSDFACYTQEAASGAGSSNIASGAVSAADTVRRYIEDWNVPSLGHRRWTFNPRLEQTAFGIRNGYSCMYVFDTSGSANPEFVAYPSRGYFPAEALHGKWSLSSGTLSLNSNTEVTIQNLSSGSSVSVANFDYHPADMMRPRMISWNVGQLPDIGETYEITVADAYSDGQDLVYEFTLVQCE